VENRLASIASPSFSALYGPDDLRSAKAIGSTTTYYLTDMDGQPLVEEMWTGTTAYLSLIYARRGRFA